MYLVTIQHLGEYEVYTLKFALRMAMEYQGQGYNVTISKLYPNKGE